MTRRGFSLVELMMAIILVGVVAGSIYQLLLSTERGYRAQSERVSVTANLRNAISLLPGDVRELNAADPLGSDIISMGASAVTYRAMRNLYFLCQPPNPAAAQIVLAQDFWFGLRPYDSGRDWLVVFQENDPATRQDNAWLHADVSSIAVGNACPGSRPSLTFTLSNVVPANPGLWGVAEGAPVRGFELVEFLLDQDANHDWWLTTRQFSKSSTTWGPTQAILGPLTSDGLQLRYFDGTGAATATPDAVASISITVTGQISQSGGRPPGSTSNLHLATRVALRNNRR
jgi:prepilin-type N-terminal cleavage/methylation domain-containing protein